MKSSCGRRDSTGWSSHTFLVVYRLDWLALASEPSLAFQTLEPAYRWRGRRALGAAPWRPAAAAAVKEPKARGQLKTEHPDR